MLRTAISRWFGSLRCAHAVPVSRRRQLLVELLEERRLLSTVNWVNPAGGAWNVPGNWSTGALPGAADDVVINLGNPNVTITHAAGTDTISSLTSNALVTISGGSLTVTGTAQVTNTFT